jgi:hypothetical protein
MNSDQILMPAMLVFGLLVVGLVLTVLEFRHLHRKHTDDHKENGHQS